MALLRKLTICLAVIPLIVVASFWLQSKRISLHREVESFTIISADGQSRSVTPEEFFKALLEDNFVVREQHDPRTLHDYDFFVLSQKGGMLIQVFSSWYRPAFMSTYDWDHRSIQSNGHLPPPKYLYGMFGYPQIDPPHPTAWHGFDSHIEWNDDPPKKDPYEARPFGTKRIILVISYWFLTFVTFLPPAWLIRRYVRRNLQIFRRAKGLCERCGYDLRASKDKCPECGTEIPRTSASAADHPPAGGLA